MKTQISLKIEKELNDKLNKLAKEEGRKKTFLLEQALKNYFNSKK